MECPDDNCNYETDSPRGLSVHWGMVHEGDIPIEINDKNNPSKRPEVKEKIKQGNKGKTPWWEKQGEENPTQEGRSIEWAEKISKAHEGKRYQWMEGEGNPNWRGGHGGNKGIPFGDNWLRKRRERLEVDGHECALCDEDEAILVHHRKPRRFIFHHPFLSLEEHGNDLDNLVTLCFQCHGKVEQGSIELKDERIQL